MFTHVNTLNARKIKLYFKIKHLREYYDLYFPSNTLLLADVFENFQNTCLEIFELDPARFLTAPGLTWQAALKSD